MEIFVNILVGVIIAVEFIFLVTLSENFAKEKRILAIGLIVTALIYVGFGMFSETLSQKLIELSGVPLYGVFAWLGVKKSGWFLAFGWAFHVAWDTVLHGVSTPFVPDWYIGLCIGFDLAVAAYIIYKETK